MTISLLEDLDRRLRADGPGNGGRDVAITSAALGILKHAAREIGSPGVRDKRWWDSAAPFVVCDEFLAPRELSKLRDWVLDRQDAFAPATLVGGETASEYIDKEFRLSDTLFDVEQFRPLFETRIDAYLDFICSRLSRPMFVNPTYELQLTATRNGGFFRTHDDNTHVANRSRRLTFVYYFYLDSMNWSGGELRFQPCDIMPTPLDVSPVQNRLVFFDSSLRHEVRTFFSERDDFRGARFTLNGWVHQDDWV